MINLLGFLDLISLFIRKNSTFAFVLNISAKYVKQTFLTVYHSKIKQRNFDILNHIEFITPHNVKISQGHLNYDFNHINIDIDIICKWLSRALNHIININTIKDIYLNLTPSNTNTNNKLKIKVKSNTIFTEINQNTLPDTNLNNKPLKINIKRTSYFDQTKLFEWRKCQIDMYNIINTKLYEQNQSVRLRAICGRSG